MTGSDKIRAVVEAAANDAIQRYDPTPRRWRTIALAAGIVLVVSLLLGAGMVVWRFAALRATAQDNARVAEQLGDQVRDLGAVPRVRLPDTEPGDAGTRRDPIPPAAWTWLDSAGRTQSCERTGGPDDAPTYSCTTPPPRATVPGADYTAAGGP